MRTLWGILGEMGLEWLPVHRLWRLNERSYGALQGMNKAETAAQHGEAQVKVRRVCVLGGSRELRLLLSDGLPRYGSLMQQTGDCVAVTSLTQKSKLPPTTSPHTLTPPPDLAPQLRCAASAPLPR